MNLLKGILLILCITFSLDATICLNMIIKDESLVIRRCLESVKPFIDYWVIVDTGSTDGTQEIVREVMKDLPGELHERPWVDFAYNRNEAISLAKGKGDYLFFIDADEELIIQPGFKKPLLKDDYYLITRRQEHIAYGHLSIVNNHLPWQWVGAVHEELICNEAKVGEHLKGVEVLADSKEGNRARDPNTGLKDAAILENLLKEDPTNARYMFYLAQSYMRAKEYDKALEAYQKRSAMGGVPREVYWSLYGAGLLQEHLEKPFDVVVDGYTKAFLYNSRQPEPLYRLSCYFFKKGLYGLSYILAKEGLALSYDPFFMEFMSYRDPAIHEHGLLRALGAAAAHLGKKEEAKWALEKALALPTLPEDLQKEVVNNLNWIRNSP